MSAALQAKVEKLGQVKTRAQAILDQYKDGGMPADKSLEVDVLLREAKSLRGEIDSERALEAKKADLIDLERYLREPIHKVPHGVNGDDDDRKTLARAGWEVKGGMVYKMTSLGKQIEMYPEEVLFGEIPTNDHGRANFYKTTRHAMTDEYKSAYEAYLRATATAPDASMVFNMLSGAQQKALSEGTDTAGGFLVPPDVQAELLVRTAQIAVIRRYARVQTTSRDIMQWPMVAPHASSGSIYSSGFVGGWVGETPAFSDTDPGFQMLGVPIKKIRVATKLSNDFIADASINILAFLAQNGSENMALVEDHGFINGDGTALQPRGLLNSGISTFDVEGSTSNLIINTTSNAGSAPKIIAGAYQLPDQYVSNARWVMRRAIEGKIRALVDASGRPHWPPMLGSGFAAAPPELVGFPVVNSSFMPDDGADANKVLLLGDLSAYVIAQRAQITSTVLRERFADTDQTGIILFERVGGACWNVDALRIGVV